jgi:hypothetical protein
MRIANENSNLWARRSIIRIRQGCSTTTTYLDIKIHTNQRAISRINYLYGSYCGLLYVYVPSDPQSRFKKSLFVHDQ